MNKEKFQSFAAIMIAIVTVLSALVAWRASAASTEAGDADFRGLVSTVKSEESRVLNTIRVLEHYQAFLIYTRYDQLGYKLYDEIQTSPPNVDVLTQQKSDFWGMSYGIQSEFFPSRYLRPDGTYDSQRELDELLADDQRSFDTRSDVHFGMADLMRRKANWLVAMLIVLGVSFWFFTLSQIIESKVRYLIAVVGVFFLLAASFAVLVIEIAMRG